MAFIGNRLDLVVSVVPNAFWATSKKAAVQLLKTLPAIQMMAISADQYHQLTIPFRHVINAIEAASECGVSFGVAVCTDNIESKAYKQTMDKLSRFVDEEKIRISITFPVGRASKGQKKSRLRNSVDSMSGNMHDEQFARHFSRW